MKTLRLRNVSKAFGNEAVLENLSLEIPGGKFFALLGPSGCGKTTVLRLLAGLEKVDSGSISLGNVDITSTPVYERRINTVFQTYALFPHLSVFENVAYSLKLRGIPRSEIEDKVHNTLKVVRLEGHAWKQISRISGGQQQRAALARAIVGEPDVLLLDEPLAALDLRLKEQMLIELIDLQDRLGTTFVYVTHDQHEALTVADSMAILNADGEIEQLDSPRDIYEFPNSRFVANFVGTNNMFKGTINSANGEMAITTETAGTLQAIVPQKCDWMVKGATVYASLRPEKIKISKDEQSGYCNHLEGKVVDIIYYGSSTQYRVEIEKGMKLKVFEQSRRHSDEIAIDYEDRVHLYFKKESIVLLER
ncbi:ABC transporter ATP-binding protein [bacterium]|nr:ABC transporter ATP-binding protein [bacterium]